MNLLSLSLRNILHRPLQSLLSLLLLALGVGLISSVLSVQQQVEGQLEKNLKGIDMVVGAKGSPLQLILSAVLQIDNPTGNIPLSEANRIRRHPLVKYSIPLSYGDSYQGYRIVGTDTSYISLHGAALYEGELWDEGMEVVAGAEAARSLELSIGDTFLSTHGLGDSGPAHDHQAFTIVGILDWSGSVADRLLLTSTQSVWDIHAKPPPEEHSDKGHDHEERGHEGHEHEEHDHKEHEEHAHGEEHREEGREITALLVKFKSPAGAIMLPRAINENTPMQAAVPSYQVNRLLDLLGVGVDALGALALLIMLVSGISVFISLYNALKERLYELALMRTYGASPRQLFRLLLFEGLLLSGLGFILGILLSRLGLLLLSVFAGNAHTLSDSLWTWPLHESLLLIATLGIGLLAALLPALKAVRVDISEALR